jgi:hypothetical protein
MGLTADEAELRRKLVRFLKAEMKRADVTYAELSERLKDHGLQETESSIANKLVRGAFPATFFMATLAALKMEEVRLEDL